VLGRSPSNAFWVEVLEELVTEFKEQAEWCSHLEYSGLRVCDLILVPSTDQVRLANCLEQDNGQLQAEYEECREVDAKLESL
jgi:hypothetical protein